MVFMTDLKVVESINWATNQDNEVFPYQEGKKLSKFLQFLVFCHEPSNGQTKLTINEFQDKLTRLRDDTKTSMSEIDLYSYGLKHEYHTDRVEFLISKEGVVTGDQGGHGDEEMPYKVAMVPCQNSTEPTVVLRRNEKFRTDSMDAGEVLQLLDDMSAIVKTERYELEPLKPTIVRYLPEANREFSDLLNVYLQTLLFPCFRRKEAIFKYKKRENVVVQREEPCCGCFYNSKCVQKSCPCKCEGKDCTNCQATKCMNNKEGQKQKKEASAARKAAKTAGLPPPPSNEERNKTMKTMRICRKSVTD
jgi:hypothetical protein